MSALCRWFNNLPRRYGRIVASASYVPQIDGMRFLAILQVVIYHSMLRGQRAFDVTLSESIGPAAWLSHGTAGVELFFFISGYIVSYPFLAGRAPSYRNFLKRRLYRLEPPYIVVLLGCFLLLQFYKPGANAPSFHHVEASLWKSLATSLLYLHGLIFQAAPRLNPPLWSLELEIQFYLLAPFLIAAYLAIGSRVARTIIVLLFVAALGAAQRPLAGAMPILGFTLLTHAYAFLLGILICDYAIVSKPFEKPALRVFDLCLIGIPLLLLTGSLYNPAKIGSLESAGVVLLRALSIVLIYFAAARGNIGRRLFGATWISFIGGACYSIYLTHIPVLQAVSELMFQFGAPPNLYLSWAVATLVLVPAAVMIGLIYYLLIERPCMQRDWPRRLRQHVASRWARRDGTPA